MGEGYTIYTYMHTITINRYTIRTCIHVYKQIGWQIMHKYALYNVVSISSPDLKLSTYIFTVYVPCLFIFMFYLCISYVFFIVYVFSVLLTYLHIFSHLCIITCVRVCVFVLEINIPIESFKHVIILLENLFRCHLCIYFCFAFR